MDAPTTSQPSLPNASLHSTADNLQTDSRWHDSPPNSLAHKDDSPPLELSEAEMGLNLLKKQAELVRLEIQQLELELAIHQARHGNREPLAKWQKKHGTPWPQLTESHSATRYPNQNSPQQPSIPQPENLFVPPHNATISAIQHSPIQANQIQTRTGQDRTGASSAGQGSVQPVLYALLSNFSPSTTSAHANSANPSIVIRHPLSPGQHSHPSTYPIETHSTNLVRHSNNLPQDLCESPASLELAPFSIPLPYNALGYQIHSHHDTPPVETARENMTESRGDSLRIAENPSSLSRHPSSPPVSPSPTHRRDQTLPSRSTQHLSKQRLSTQPNETNTKASGNSTPTHICETHFPQSLNSLDPTGADSQQPTVSTTCHSVSLPTPQEEDHSLINSNDAISLIRPQALGTKTDSPKDTKALLAQTQSANKSPAATSLREPVAKPKTTRPNKNQRSSSKESPHKPSTSATSLRLANPPNRAVLSRKKTPSWVTSIAIHSAAIFGLMAVTLKIPEVNAPFALTAFIEPADSLAVEASPMETTATLEASSENETFAEAVQADLLQPETTLSQTDLQSAIATTTTALKPIVSDHASAGSTSPGDKLAADLLSTNAGGMQTTSEVQSLSKASFFGVQASGNIFCYVVDNSGSMRGEPFEATKKELLRSISLLKPNQRFYVLFFNQQLSPMQLFGEEQGAQIPNVLPLLAPAQAMDPAAAFSVAEPNEATTPVPAAAYANPDNFLRLQRWIETVSIGNGGPPNQALKMAIELQPDCIFLLTDGVTRSDVTGFLRKNNRREDLLDGTQIRCQINTIGFYSREGEALLQRIASENGGQYLYVPNPRDSQKP